METQEKNLYFQEESDGADSLDSLLTDLSERAATILSELEEFRRHLRNIRQEQHIEVAHFRNTVRSELDMLRRLSVRDDNQSSSHIARSSNLPFLETAWTVAKQSKSLVALHKRVYFNSHSESFPKTQQGSDCVPKRPRRQPSKSQSITIDAITDGGLSWKKVSLVTNTRLLFDLAKQGWQSEASDDENDVDFSNTTINDPISEVPLVKTTNEICQAARARRVRTRYPQVHLILPRVQRHQTPEIDAVLDNCAAAGAILHCGDLLDRPIPITSTIMHSMAPDPIASIRGPLNVDCTILLALVSDFSHGTVAKEPWFHTALNRQVETEGNENLLPALLYPALGAWELFCTREAARRMREIVDTIGTPSEKARTGILLGDNASHTQAQLVQDMRRWSARPVPGEWKLPIRIVDQNEHNCQSCLSPEALAASEFMTAFNKSVFRYGWASRCTTITSNRRVVKQVMNHLDQFEDLADDVWPKVWVCPTARSLVGKEKGGAKRKDVRIATTSVEETYEPTDPMDALTLGNDEDVDDLKPLESLSSKDK